ncbi:MAG: hypothetical protein ABMA01_17095, partial [Chthoniobacteraceae bacterium]
RTFFAKKDAASAMGEVLAQHAAFAPVDLVVSGGNGTWADDAIAAGVEKHFVAARPPWMTPKAHLGEALGAGALLQVVLGADALGEAGGGRALVAAVGWNQQAAAAIVERNAVASRRTAG